MAGGDPPTTDNGLVMFGGGLVIFDCDLTTSSGGPAAPGDVRRWFGDFRWWSGDFQQWSGDIRQRPKVICRWSIIDLVMSEDDWFYVLKKIIKSYFQNPLEKCFYFYMKMKILTKHIFILIPTFRKILENFIN